MSDDRLPSLSEWLQEYRSRPSPREVVVSSVSLPAPMTSDVSRMSGIVALKILRYDEPQNPRPTGGFYLMATDADGRELSDTWHEDMDAAFSQAEYEFGIGRDAWQPVRDEGT